MLKKFNIFFSFIILVNCSSNSGDSNKKLSYSTVNIEFKSSNCEPETNACLMVSISYPQFANGDSLARHLANRIVKNSILDNIGIGDVESMADLSIELAVEDLNKSFEDLKKEFNKYNTGWQAFIKTKELFNSDSVLVLEISSMTYFGGAHPNSNIRYFNFDKNTGRFMPLSTFVSDIEQFTNNAEVVFKKKYNIEEDTSYDSAGFEFLGNNFILSANYAFLGDSITLHYNHYEIAPYAAGDFGITVSIK